MRQETLLEDSCGGLFKRVRATRTEALLRHIASNAEKKGMQINQKKTCLMIASAAISFDPQVEISMGQVKIIGSNSLKLVGVHLDRDCSFKTHVNKIRSKLRSKTWALLRLKKAGLEEQQLIKVYKNPIRPYAIPVWHSSITAEQSATLERQQSLVLRNIYGPNTSARKMRDKGGLESLRERSEKNCLIFAKKNLNNPRCKRWFIERNRPLYARRMDTYYPRYKE